MHGTNVFFFNSSPVIESYKLLCNAVQLYFRPVNCKLF